MGIEMHNLMQRVERTEKILSGSYSNTTKIINALPEFSGLNLSVLDSRLKKIITTCFARYNAIVTQYEIATVEDYSKIKRKDLKEMTNLLNDLCRQVRLSLNTEMI